MDTAAPARSRSYEWQDPLASAQAARGLSGLEFLRKIVAGEIPGPPIAHTLGYALLDIGDGTAAFGIEPREFHYNPIGMVHGGIACTLLDSAMGCAVHSTLDAGDIYTTLEFKINFLRALSHETGVVRGIGLVINETRTTALAEGRLEDGEGKLYAFATTTCVIRRAKERSA